MKAMFSVEDAGSVAAEIETESQGLLAEFVDFIKVRRRSIEWSALSRLLRCRQTKKVVLVEELAARFSLKSKDALLRLRALQEMGRITGVMDDRGKFVYVSEAEMDAVAKFVRQRGRVAISELSDHSHRLIALTGES